MTTRFPLSQTTKTTLTTEDAEDAEENRIVCVIRMLQANRFRAMSVRRSRISFLRVLCVLRG